MKEFNNRYYYIKKGLSAFALALFVASVVSYRLEKKYSIPRGLETLYYNNRGFYDEPVFKELEEKIDLKNAKIEELSPNRKNYSIEWEGYLFIEEAGVYEFTTASDDGSVIFVDDILVVDNGGFHSLREVSGEIFLLPGFHSIWIRYCQGEGADTLLFKAFKQAQKQSSISKKQFFPSIPPLRALRIEQRVETYTRVVYYAWGIGILSLAAIWLLIKRRRVGGKKVPSSKQSPPGT
ncbi:MAG: PA14 domain-containing protein [Candidatus Aminicenantes bacterium]|nr:PA14 domain-containing protein [Candidatus Aminicenantes bacterium]MDH5714383.1 PA14 domain-containing protein [Candidatus Aminicenantes bacterium]